MIYHVISAILFYWKCCQGIKYARKVDWFASCDMTSYLNKHLTNVYFSEERRFTYYDPIYVRSFPGFENKYQFLNVSVDSLLQPSKDQSKKCCYYYSGDVTNSPFSALSHLILMNKVFRDFKNIEELNVNIWITQPLLTATLHYDAVNNLFIQIHGSKKVVLYPPRMVGELYIHGRLHPHACQSRLDQYCLTESTNTNTKEDYCSANTDNSDTVTFVAGSSVNVTPYSIVMRKHTKEMFDECWDVGDGIQIDLHAGDVLVIPPFWFHKV
ncbi:hypothetical protein EON65_35500 [archaeon]|nr:MAG: hypothetical protein EON65_35500 [archaeon]